MRTDFEQWLSSNELVHRALSGHLVKPRNSTKQTDSNVTGIKHDLNEVLSESGRCTGNQEDTRHDGDD